MQQANQVEPTAPTATEDVFQGDNWSRQINMKKFPERAQFTIELTETEIIVNGVVTNERDEYDMKVTTTEKWSKAFKRPKKIIAATVRCTTDGHFLKLTGSKVGKKNVVPVLIKAVEQPIEPIVIVEPLLKETTPKTTDASIDEPLLCQ
jgi:Ni,Fe-hydrogenase III small subunit